MTTSVITFSKKKELVCTKSKLNELRKHQGFTRIECALMAPQQILLLQMSVPPILKWSIVMMLKY
jgi:hypothetical protein